MAWSEQFDLLTIGHSNQPIDRFLALLRDAGVTAVADVRSRPFSRRFPWFSQKRLAERLARHGRSAGRPAARSFAVLRRRGRLPGDGGGGRIPRRYRPRDRGDAA